MLYIVRQPVAAAAAYYTTIYSTNIYSTYLNSLFYIFFYVHHFAKKNLDL